MYVISLEPFEAVGSGQGCESCTGITPESSLGSSTDASLVLMLPPSFDGFDSLADNESMDKMENDEERRCR